jgi:hypothetical protein
MNLGIDSIKTKLIAQQELSNLSNVLNHEQSPCKKCYKEKNRTKKNINFKQKLTRITLTGSTRTKESLNG